LHADIDDFEELLNSQIRFMHFFFFNYFELKYVYLGGSANIGDNYFLYIFFFEEKTNSPRSGADHLLAGIFKS